MYNWKVPNSMLKYSLTFKAGVYLIHVNCSMYILNSERMTNIFSYCFYDDYSERLKKKKFYAECI